MQPIKIRDARRMIAKAGGSIIEGKGGHAKVTHPSMSETFPLPAHGSRGRQTLSPGVTHQFHKFYALMLDAKAQTV
jgi:predicted RNA binding protein YcfA (HicA-like mRNA interferase family)